MKENDNIKETSEDFTVMSFSSTANENLEFPANFEEESPTKEGYCFIIGFVILVFAIIELSTNFNEVEYRIELNRNGNQYLSDNIFVSFNDKTQIAIYLEIEHITQIDYIELNDFMDECQGYMTNEEMGKTTSIINTTLNPKDIAIPCGKHASFYPEGILEIIDTSDNKSIPISTDGIGPKNPPFDPSNQQPEQQWANFSSERYQNWMTPNAQEKVEKLWGMINNVLSGNFQFKITVNNEMPQVERIIIFLENNKALAGYNAELLYVNSVYAFFVFIGALANFLIQKKCSHRKVLKKKPLVTGHSNEIKIFLNSAADTPAVKFD